MMRAAFVVLCLLLLTAFDAKAADRPDILEIMNIDGVIDDGMANRVTKQVEEINDNPRIKAVLLVVDSPGGGVLPSSVIYEELAKLKVPVVGWCNNICASGGMYLLMSPTVKYIGVRTTTISGSIGVIMTITKYNRLLDWIRVDNTTFKSGKSKDAGNPTTPMGDEEKASLQGEIDLLASRFYARVAKARPKITDKAWDDIKTARIFFGVDGVKIGLVDEVMSFEGAEKKAKSLSGSDLIYTRDEVKKMSKIATGDLFGNSVAKPSRWESLADDAAWLMQMVREIRMGESVKMEYRLPYAY